MRVWNAIFLLRNDVGDVVRFGDKDLQLSKWYKCIADNLLCCKVSIFGTIFHNPIHSFSNNSVHNPFILFQTIVFCIAGLVNGCYTLVSLTNVVLWNLLQCHCGMYIHLMHVEMTFWQDNFCHYKRDWKPYLEEYFSYKFQNERFTHTLSKIFGARGLFGE